MNTVCVDYCVTMYHMNKKVFELSIFDHFEKYCVIQYIRMHSNSVDQCIQFREKKIDMYEQIKEWLSGTDQVMDRTGNARTAKKRT